MRVIKFFIDYDKEEKWLNEMAKKGYELENASCGYKFRYTKPQNSVIRIDYRSFKRKEDFTDYCTLFEDSGWKHIAGTKNSGTQYFKKIDENSDDDIFSDNISKAARYKRLSEMFSTIVICYVPILSFLISNKSININTMINPKLLYYTPGLWEKSGVSFWGSFLFETPFAMMRGFAWLFIPIILILFTGFSIKANRLYYKQNKN